MRVVQRRRHLAAHAGESAVLHDEGKPFHFGGRLHGRGRAHGFSLKTPYGVLREEIAHEFIETLQIQALAETHGAVGSLAFFVLPVVAVVVGHKIEAQIQIELSVGEHCDVVSRPAVAEDHGALSAVGEGERRVRGDDAAPETVAARGLIREVLDLVFLQDPVRVYVAVVQHLFPGAVVGVAAGRGDHLREEKGHEEGQDSKKDDYSQNDVDYNHVMPPMPFYTCVSVK